MKRKFYIMLFALTFVSFATICSAYNFNVGDLKFSITDANSKTVKLTEMVRYAPTNGNVVIPSKVTNTNDGLEYTVTGLDKHCFVYSEITSVFIPNTVTRIDSFAFRECQKLKTVTFESGNKMTRLYRSTFEYCGAMESIVLPDGITVIEDWNFLECKSMTSVTLPSKITNIMNFAFRDCPLLEELICPATFPPTVADGTFYATFITDVSLVVPKGSKKNYDSVSPWNTFLEILERVFTSAITKTVYDKDLLISRLDNMITVKGLSGFDTMKVFDVSGKILYNKSINDNIETFELPSKGIYIINVDNLVRKISM